MIIYRTINLINSKIHKNTRKVIGTNIKTGKIVMYDSITPLEKESIFDKIAVSKCCRKERQTHRNYTWNYKGNRG